MNVSVLGCEDYKTSSWSGGTTTELYLWPRDGSYAERDFLFRLSTASVEQEESTFTHLPGIKRILMPLTGEMVLVHEGEASRTLKPYRQDVFMGDHKTVSRGKARDFGIMTRPGCEAFLSVIELEPGIRKKIYVAPSAGVRRMEFFFPVQGRAKLGCGAGEMLLAPGMLLAAEDAEGTFTAVPEGQEALRMLWVSVRVNGRA